MNHMDVSAEADAFLQGLQAEVEPSNTQQPAGEPSAADLIAQAQAAAASLNASVGTQPAAQQQADGVLANGSAPAPEEESSRQRKRRNRWGNPAADVSDAAPAQALPSPAAPVAAFTPTPEPEQKKKRRSRWEDTDASDETAIAQIKPKELVLPGGIKVQATICKAASAALLHVYPARLSSPLFLVFEPVCLTAPQQCLTRNVARRSLSRLLCWV